MADEGNENPNEEAQETSDAPLEEVTPQQESQGVPPEEQKESSAAPSPAEPPEEHKPPTPPLPAEPVQESPPEEPPPRPVEERPVQPTELKRPSRDEESAKEAAPQEEKKEVETNLTAVSSERDKRKSGEIDPESLMPQITPPKGKRQSMSKELTQRRQKTSSKAKLILGSILDIKSTVQAEYYGAAKVPKYANSYRLEAENPFNHEKVEKILKEVMIEVLENLTYDPEKCAQHAKNASKTIRQKVKQLEFDRYKIVCMVTIGEKNSQDVFVTCRGLWDIEKDRYSTYAMENTQVYGIAYCFGMYYE